MEIRTDAYKKEGMYLHFANGKFLDLSVDAVKKLSDEYWADLSKLPPEMREQADFKTCSVCPFRGQNVFCSAMKPILPFLEQMEDFSSCSKVTAVYVDHDGVSSFSETDAQKALQYVTNMALFIYCEDAKQFHRYFRGIHPFMRFKEAIARVALNLYWIHRGDRQQIDAIIADMRWRVTETSKSCIKRLNVICKSDAFKNAYVNTQTFTEFLFKDMDHLLTEYFEEEALGTKKCMGES